MTDGVAIALGAMVASIVTSMVAALGIYLTYRAQKETKQSVATIETKMDDVATKVDGASTEHIRQIAALTVEVSRVNQAGATTPDQHDAEAAGAPVTMVENIPTVADKPKPGP